MLPMASPDVVFAEVEAGAVLFSIPDETYYSLNAVGARVWQLLPPASNTLEELCATVNADYPDVPRPQLQEDIRELLADLDRMGLVRYRNGSDGSAGDEPTRAV